MIGGNVGNLELANRSISFQGQANILSNAYFSSTWKYTNTTAPAFYTQNSGQHSWYTAPSGTAGNPITFTQVMVLDAAGSLQIKMPAAMGYGTGSGGTVTQATSRTTGVTINKPAGSITLVSAAGSTAWQTFTVTNSTVVVDDTVRVVQRSGTDKYQIHVTNVAAGSFQLTFATTGGTTTEQPVFNFNVMKGAVA